MLRQLTEAKRHHMLTGQVGPCNYSFSFLYFFPLSEAVLELNLLTRLASNSVSASWAQGLMACATTLALMDTLIKGAEMALAP